MECSPVRFLLSSRHLTLASRYFRAELNGPWTEATADSIDGLRHIEASDWDDQALLLLMRILHGLNREVPRKITLEMLAKIAVLVDYYDCREAVELAVHMWIDALEDCLPLECNRDLTLWLLVSSTFRQPETFRSITKTAIQESRAPLPALDLPISQNVIGKRSFTQDGNTKLMFAAMIDSRRQEAIDTLVLGLEGLIATFLRGNTDCDSYRCESILLGALMKQLYTHGLSHPTPKRPYLGYSLTATLKTLRDFYSPVWSVPDAWGGAHSCSLEDLIEHVVKPIQRELEGLDLDIVQ